MVTAMPLENSRGLAALGIPLTGLSWSAGVWVARAVEIEATGIGPLASFLLVSLGGLTQTLAAWIGFCAVLWAMVRVLKGKIEIAPLIVLTSLAATPLWFGGFAGAFAIYSDGISAIVAMGIALACLAGFLALATHALARELAWRRNRAGFALFGTMVFLISVISLTL